MRQAAAGEALAGTPLLQRRILLPTPRQSGDAVGIKFGGLPLSTHDTVIFESDRQQPQRRG